MIDEAEYIPNEYSPSLHLLLFVSAALSAERGEEVGPVLAVTRLGATERVRRAVTNVMVTLIRHTRNSCCSSNVSRDQALASTVQPS